jgi:glutamate/tyrosine decarboxylase-like PLP-dependent enzyme
MENFSEDENKILDRIIELHNKIGRLIEKEKDFEIVLSALCSTTSSLISLNIKKDDKDLFVNRLCNDLKKLVEEGYAKTKKD